MARHFCTLFILIPGSSLGQALGLSDRGSGDVLLWEGASATGCFRQWTRFVRV